MDLKENKKRMELEKKQKVELRMATAGVKRKRTVLTIENEVKILDKLKSCSASKLQHIYTNINIDI